MWRNCSGVSLGLVLGFFSCFFSFFKIFFCLRNALLFPVQPCNRQTSRPVGLLARKYFYLSESALLWSGNLAIVGQILEQIKLQLVWWNTTSRGTDRRIMTLVWNHVACFHFHIIFAGWRFSLMEVLSTTEMWCFLSLSCSWSLPIRHHLWGARWHPKEEFHSPGPWWWYGLQYVWQSALIKLGWKGTCEFQVVLPSEEECVQLACISPFWYFLDTKKKKFQYQEVVLCIGALASVWK